MSDVWPRRNLGRGENWGRSVESRVDDLERSGDLQDQSQGGYGRYAASTADSIREVATRVEEALRTNPRYFTKASGLAGFGFGGDWATVVAITERNPGTFESLEVSAFGTVTSKQVGSTSNRFIWPFSLASVSSEFGPRAPLPFHNGIDFSYSGITGTPIPATHDGTVILRGSYADWGNYTRVDCSALTGVANSWTGYAHMQALPLNPVGTVVTQGQTLGYVGQTGYVTGPHLHYETALENERINPRDFMAIFGGTSVSLVSVEARIVINGVASPTFRPYTEMGISQNQLNYPVFGVSLSGTPSLEVLLQMRAPGISAPPDPATTASLTVRGGFH